MPKVYKPGVIDFNDVPLKVDPVKRVEEPRPTGGKTLAIDKQAESIMGLASEQGIGLAEAEEASKEETYRQIALDAIRSGSIKALRALVRLPADTMKQVELIERRTRKSKRFLPQKFGGPPRFVGITKERMAKILQDTSVFNPNSPMSKLLDYSTNWAEQGLTGILERHPEWQKDPPESFVDLLTSPKKLTTAVIESVPMLVSAGILTATGHPVAAYVVIYAIEGDDAAEEAKAFGATEEQQLTAKGIYGTVAAALEMVQIGQGIALAKGSYRAIRNRMAKQVLSQITTKGEVSLTKQWLSTIARENVEEWAQGIWQEKTAKMVYGKEQEGGLTGFIDRRLQESLVITALTIPTGGAGVAAGAVRGKVAAKAKPTAEGKEAPAKKEVALTEMPWKDLQAKARELGVPAFQSRETLIPELERKMELAAMPTPQRLKAMQWPELQREARKRGIHAFQQRDKLEEAILLQEGLKDISPEEQYGAMSWSELQSKAREMGIDAFQKRSKVIADLLGREIEPEEGEAGRPVVTEPKPPSDLSDEDLMFQAIFKRRELGTLKEIAAENPDAQEDVDAAQEELLSLTDELTSRGIKMDMIEPKPPTKPTPAEIAQLEELYASLDKPVEGKTITEDMVNDIAVDWEDFQERMKEVPAEEEMLAFLKEFIEWREIQKGLETIRPGLANEIETELSALEGYIDGFMEGPNFMRAAEELGIDIEGRVEEAMAEEKPTEPLAGQVEQLITEVPGISEEEQELLLLALSQGAIPETFPSYSEMMDELTKLPEARRLGKEEQIEALEGKAGALADKADVQGMYLQYVLLPRAEQTYKKPFKEKPPTTPKTPAELLLDAGYWEDRVGALRSELEALKQLKTDTSVEEAGIMEELVDALKEYHDAEEALDEATELGDLLSKDKTVEGLLKDVAGEEKALDEDEIDELVFQTEEDKWIPTPEKFYEDRPFWKTIRYDIGFGNPETLQEAVLYLDELINGDMMSEGLKDEVKRMEEEGDPDLAAAKGHLVFMQHELRDLLRIMKKGNIKDPGPAPEMPPGTPTASEKSRDLLREVLGEKDLKDIEGEEEGKDFLDAVDRLTDIVKVLGGADFEVVSKDKGIPYPSIIQNLLLEAENFLAENPKNEDLRDAIGKVKAEARALGEYDLIGEEGEEDMFGEEDEDEDERGPTYKGPRGRPGFLRIPRFRRKKKPTPVEPPPPAGKGPYRAPSQDELNKTNDELLAKLSEVQRVRKDEEIPAIKKMRTQQIARSLGIQEAAAAEGAPAADVIRRSKGGYKVSADTPQYTPIKLTKKQWDAYSRQIYNVYTGPQYKFQQTAAQDALDKLKDGRLITDAEAALLIPVMGIEVAEQIAATMEKLGDKYQRFWNLARDLVLFWKMPFNFDVQFLRNAVNFVGRHPVKYTKGAYEALRSFASKDYSNTLIDATRKDPAFAEAEAYGMPFLQMGQLAPIGKVPEQFRGRLPYRMAKVGKKRGKVFRKATSGIRFIGKWQLAAERSFVASANYFMLDLWKMRSKQWDASLALLEEAGLSVDERERIKIQVNQHKKNYADVVGNYIKIIQAKSSTGRAIQTGANYLLWSPSTTWSRFRRPEMMMLKSGSRAYAMSIEATSIAKIYAVTMLLTTVANYFRDDDDQIEVEFDPTSSNWGRFKQGDTWFDFGAGEIQHYRALAQVSVAIVQEWTGVGAVKTQSGRRVEVPPTELMKNYIEGRETALIGIFHEILTGESLFGQKVWAAPDLEQLEKEGTVTADIYAEAWRRSANIPGGQDAFLTGRWLTEHLMPAALAAFVEASITDGWPIAVAAGLTETIAMGTQSYKQRASAELAILQEVLAQAYYKTPWDVLTQDEQNDIRTQEPQLHDVLISIRKERQKWAAPEFDRSKAIEIQEQLFASLSEAVQEELNTFGLTAGTVGRRFGPTDKPFYLNEARFTEYLAITKNRVQSKLDLLIGSAKYKRMDKQKQEDTIQAAVSKAKAESRKELTKMINRGEI